MMRSCANNQSVLGGILAAWSWVLIIPSRICDHVGVQPKGFSKIPASVSQALRWDGGFSVFMITRPRAVRVLSYHTQHLDIGSSAKPATASNFDDI